MVFSVLKATMIRLQTQNPQPPIQWSDRQVGQGKQKVWVYEAIGMSPYCATACPVTTLTIGLTLIFHTLVNGRTVASGTSINKSAAENECCKNLLIHFKVLG